MASGVTIYCDGYMPASRTPCDGEHPTRMSRAEYARDLARSNGWTRRQGIDLCNPCSVREYGPHLKRKTRKS